MGIVAISVWVDDNKKVGLRLIDTDTYSTKDISYEDAIKALKSNKINIENIVIKFGKLAGKFNSIDEFSTIEIETKRVNKKKAVCIKEVKDLNGQLRYLVSDELGQIVLVSKLSINILRGYSEKYKIIKHYEHGLVKCKGIEILDKSIKSAELDIVINEVDRIYKFINCKYVNTMTIYGRNCEIDNNAFDGVKTIKKLFINVGEINIGSNAFYNNELTEIRIKANTGIIGLSAFKECKNLRKIDIDIQNGEIRDNVFNGCKELTDIRIRVKELRDRVFNGCEKMRKIDIDNIQEFNIGSLTKTGVTELEVNNKGATLKGVLYYDNKLKKISINESVKIEAMKLELNNNTEIEFKGAINDVTFIEFDIRVKKEDKVRVYVNSELDGHLNLINKLKTSESNIIIIDKNKDKKVPILDRLNETKLSLMGIPDKISYLIDKLSIDEQCEEVKYTGEFSEVPNKNKMIDIEKIIKRVSRCGDIEINNESGKELYEFIRYCIYKDFGHEERLANEEVWERLRKIGYKVRVNNDFSCKLPNEEMGILNISMHKEKGMGLGIIMVCVRNGKIEQISCMGDVMILLGGRMWYEVDIPFHLMTAGDIYGDDCYIDGIGKINDCNKQYNLKTALEYALSIGTFRVYKGDTKYAYNLQKKTRIVLKANPVKLQSKTQIKSINKVIDLKEKTTMNDERLSKLIDRIMIDKEYKQLLNESPTMIRKQGKYAKEILEGGDLKRIPEEQLGRLDELYFIVKGNNISNTYVTRIRQIKINDRYSINAYRCTNGYIPIGVTDNKENKIIYRYKFIGNMHELEYAIRKTYKSNKIWGLKEIVMYYENGNSMEIFIGYESVSYKVWLYAIVESTWVKVLPLEYKKSKLRVLMDNIERVPKIRELIKKIINYRIKGLIDKDVIDVITNLENGVREKSAYKAVGNTLLDVLGYIEK